MPGCVRNRAPLAPEGTPPQERPTWPGLPYAPPPELDGEGLQRWQIGVDVNPLWPWNAREDVLIKTKENYLKKSKTFQVGFSELEQFLHSPWDDAISIMSIVENPCDEGGRKKFAVLETKRGIDIEALQENQDRNYRELQEAIECMNAKQNRLLATMERQQNR